MNNYRNTADEFALKIVANQFDAAFGMLSDAAQAEWGVDDLKEAYEEMIEYFEGADVEVVTGWDEIEDVELDHGVMIYVPVESCEGGEAISVVIDSDGKITEVEFGRP